MEQTFDVEEIKSCERLDTVQCNFSMPCFVILMLIQILLMSDAVKFLCSCCENLIIILYILEVMDFMLFLTNGLTKYVNLNRVMKSE